MENKYLNLTGAVYIISKIKTLLEDKSDKGHTHSKEEIGLGNVENKSSQTIRGELTSDNVIKALGYTPPKENTREIDLSSYIKQSDMVAITNSEIDAAFA